jgi:hypothetical protein
MGINVQEEEEEEEDDDEESTPSPSSTTQQQQHSWTSICCITFRPSSFVVDTAGAAYRRILCTKCNGWHEDKETRISDSMARASCAAPSAPSIGTRRVLHIPGIGHLATTTILPCSTTPRPRLLLLLLLLLLLFSPPPIQHGAAAAAAAAAAVVMLCRLAGRTSVVLTLPLCHVNSVKIKTPIHPLRSWDVHHHRGVTSFRPHYFQSFKKFCQKSKF